MLLGSWKKRWHAHALDRDYRTPIFTTFSFFLEIGFACGITSSNALLISRAGTQGLFYVYFGSSLMTFLFAGLIYFLVDRFPRERVLLCTFEIFAALCLLFWGFLRLDPPATWPYFSARILFYAIFILTTLQFWLVAGDYFTNLEAKGRFPYFLAAGGLGLMAGSFLVQELAQTIQTVNFFLLWGLILAIAPPLFLFLLKKYHPARRFPKNPKKESAVSDSKITFPPSDRKLLQVLLLFWLAYTFFGYGVDYYFNSAALQAIPGEDRLASYFGKVAFFSLLSVFLYQVFLAGRVAMRFSVEQSVGIFCLLLFLGVGSIQFFPLLPVMASAQGLIYFFLEFAALSLLQPVTQVFPDALRGRVKVLVDGIGRPAGNFLLLLLATLLSWTWGVEKLIYFLFAGTVLFLFYPLLFKRAYIRHLLDCLNSNDPKLVLNAIQALGEIGKRPATAPLLDLLKRTPDVILKRNIVVTLGRMRSVDALPAVIEQFSLPRESLQLAVIESLIHYRSYESLFALYELMKSQENVSFQVRAEATTLMARRLGRRMLPLLQQALEDEDERIKANAIESLNLIRDHRTISLLLPYLSHSNRRIRANAAIALYPFRKVRKQAQQVIEELFGSKDAMTQFSGIYAIGELCLKDYQSSLMALLGNPDPRYRQHIVTALAKMGTTDFYGKFVELLLDPEEGLALESVRHLGRFRKTIRWRIFETISRLPAAALKRILIRLDQTPLDFSKEKELLLTPALPAEIRPL